MQDAKITPKIAIGAPSHNFLGLYLCIWGMCRQSEKKLVKQQYLLHMSLQYGELLPTNGWDRLAGLGHPSILQRVSRLGFVTAAMMLNGSQPNFARCLVVSCAAIFGGSCPLTEFYQLQNSLCAQVLRCLILTVLLHGSVTVGVKQTLRLSTRNEITELSHTGATYIRLGDHHVGHRPTF